MNMQALLTGMEWFPLCAGGLHRYFYDEVHALPSLGIDGTALVTYLDGAQNSPLRLRAMAEPGAPLMRQWSGAHRAAKEALREGVDVINAHFALYAYPWVRSIPRTTPLVVHFHGPWADEMAVESGTLNNRIRVLLARRIERSVYAKAERLITLSHAFKNVLQDGYGVAPERIRVIPGGIDAAPFLAAPDRSTARRLLGWPEERRILLSVRRLTRRMGLDVLIDAMQEVRRRNPDCLLLIAGKGPLAADIDARIESLNLRDHVRRIGFVPDEVLPLAYAAADISVVPSVALEGFGLTTLESLASGTPVMGTPVGGIPEILGGLCSDLIFDAVTAEAIARRLGDALAGEIEMPSRDECRAYVQPYTWPQIAPRIRAVFGEAMACADSFARPAPRLTYARQPHTT